MSLQVRDFAIVDQIDIEFKSGMTVLTGETGAGKSILVDALGLVLGERGGAQLVRTGAKRAEFAAEFNIDKLSAVRAWLVEHELDVDDDCLLRRVVNADGRSRAFINGNAVPLAQLKSLGELLLDIHGQHFHQSLGKRSVQRDLLDHFGGLLDKRTSTSAKFTEWKARTEHLQNLLDADADSASRLDLLTFQLQELEALALDPDEAETLTAERQKLQNSNRLAEGALHALNCIIDDESGNANGLIAQATNSLDGLVEFDPALGSPVELLRTASIQLSEAVESLRRYGDGLEMDPRRRDWVEERLDAIHSVARKHRVSTDMLLALQEKLRNDRDDIDHADERGRKLQQEVTAAKDEFLTLARALSVRRLKAAKKFSSSVSDAMAGLGMPGGKFDVSMTALDEDSARPWGIDDIQFLISANPGHPAQPLSKIASGGELSRMSLSIQVIASNGSEIPTMIFDEIDSGVGGGVAEMLGRRLQELGSTRQVLSVTHLPQVASLADQHFRISKVTDGQSTRTRVQELNTDERIEELARMLGGVEITQKTLDHATEMLSGATKKSA